MTEAFDITAARQHLKDFDFTPLFIELLGWDHYSASLTFQVGDAEITLEAIAEKRGFAIYTCPPLDTGLMPDYATRRKIDNQATKHRREHIIVYIDTKKHSRFGSGLKENPGKSHVGSFIISYPRLAISCSRNCRDLNSPSLKRTR